MGDGASVVEKGDMSTGFTSAVTGVPLEDRAVISIGPNYDKGPNHVLNQNMWRAVNFKHILQTGDTATDENVCLPSGQRIDWNADDAYTQAVDQITEASAQRIQNDPATKALLDKDRWTRDDRVEWERRTSEIVSEEMDKIPGLGEYRIAQDNIPLDALPGDPNPPLPTDDPLVGSMTADYRATEVNNLSTDIEHGTGTVEFDCETMAITEGSVLQRIEGHFLPEDAALEGSLKQLASYFYAGGVTADIVRLEGDPHVGNYGAHAYIVSSATGNIIEATVDPSESPGISYRSLQDGYDFQDFASGRVAIADSSIYVTSAASEIISRGQEDFNNMPFEKRLEAFGHESDRLYGKLLDMNGAPEIDALHAYDEIQTKRELTTTELDDATHLYEQSVLADDFQSVEAMSFNYKSKLFELYTEAAGDPEKLEQLDGFLQGEQDRYAGLDSRTPYAVRAYGGELNVPYTEDMVGLEIDAVRQDITKDLAPEPTFTLPKLPDFNLQ